MANNKSQPSLTISVISTPDEKETVAVESLEVQSVGEVPRTDEAPVKVPNRTRVIMMGIFCLMMSVNGLDLNVLGDASPYVAAHFNVFDKISWLSTATILCAVAVVMPASKSFNCCEPKYIIITALVVMTAGEAIAGAASSFNMLLVGRVLTGLSAPINLIGSTTIVGLIWGSQKRPVMISIIIACYGVMIKVGPLVSGALIKRSINLWRWCFYVQVPILGCLLLAVVLFFPKLGTFEERSLQKILRGCWIAGLAQAVALICLLFPLVAGGVGHEYRWEGPSMIICYVLGVLGLAIYLYADITSEESDRYLPMEAMAQDRSLILMSIITFCSMYTIFATTFYLPIMYQLVFKSSALRAAVQILPGAVSGTVATIVVAKIAEITGHFIPSCILLSVVQVVGGALCYTLHTATPLWKIYVYAAVLGIGSGGLASIGTPFILEKVSIKRFGSGTALTNLFTLLGAVAGIGTQYIILTNKIMAVTPELQRLDPDLALSGDLWKNLIFIIFGNEEVKAVFNTAFMDAVDAAAIAYAVVGAISLLASLGLRWQKMHQFGHGGRRSVKKNDGAMSV